MAKLTPQQMAKKADCMADAIRRAVNMEVAVGLPAEKAAGLVYGDGVSVLLVAIWHEYGRGNNPARSFLRAPFRDRRDELAVVIHQEWKRVMECRQSLEQGLERIGAAATNISRDAFRTSGDGQWEPNRPSTRRAKGSSRPLIDKGILFGSITWVVR